MGRGPPAAGRAGVGTVGSPGTLRWWSSQALLKPWGPEIRAAGSLGFVSKPGVGAPSVDLRKARWRRRETAGGEGWGEEATFARIGLLTSSRMCRIGRRLSESEALGGWAGGLEPPIRDSPAPG